jgi:hypothetical protein
MEATNPRAVAYRFRYFLYSMRRKSLPSDPTYVKLAVLVGQVSLTVEGIQSIH